MQVLQKIRGQEDVEMEFQDIVMQTREANAIKDPMRALLKPCYRPQLVISITISVIQQLTGINAIMFYAPQVFSTFGSGRKSSLLSTVIIGAGTTLASAGTHAQDNCIFLFACVLEASATCVPFLPLELASMLYKTHKGQISPLTCTSPYSQCGVYFGGNHWG